MDSCYTCNYRSHLWDYEGYNLGRDSGLFLQLQIVLSAGCFSVASSGYLFLLLSHIFFFLSFLSPLSFVISEAVM